MSDNEILNYIDGLEDEIDKQKYTSSLERCRNNPDDRVSFVPWCIRLKDGGHEIGTALFEAGGDLSLSMLPDYSEEYGSEAEEILTKNH